MDIETVAGIFVYCADYHRGQNSRLYQLLSRIELVYRPRLSDSAWKAIRSTEPVEDPACEQARQTYRRLVDTREVTNVEAS